MTEPRPSWESIDTVLLDMDGTLLDLHFDNVFWQHHLPLRYAESRGISLEAARAELAPRFEAVHGTLDWYCLDFWRRELDLDLVLLKTEVRHLIAEHPRVIDFLQRLGERGKRRVLVTNAHPGSLALKFEQTRLGNHLDAIHTSHEFGAAKESQHFWRRLQQREPFDPARSCLVDDTLAVLRAARGYGIAHLYAVHRPDTRDVARNTEEFPAVRDFGRFMPE